METLGDLLFELSHDERRKILLLLNEKALRLTHISKKLGLTVQEVSRHLSRLDDSNLTVKGADGLFRLTPYGKLILRQLRGFEFSSGVNKYFTTHTVEQLSNVFIDRIGDLSESVYIDNAMEFLRQTETLFKETKDHIWLIVDQFPLNSLSSIVEAIERGVEFRIIEPKNRVFNPDIDSITSDEVKALSRARHTPLVEQKMVDEVHSLLYLSERRCVMAFPTSDGQYDYKGFTASDATSLSWCRDLFEYYWSEGEQRTSTTQRVKVQRGRVSKRGTLGQIDIIGHENPEVDAQAIQDAVDNYDIVILRGTFNFGTSEIQISRSVVVRGEGRENDIPSVTIYKKGWSFPFREWDSVFKIDGEDADVTIENIHFTDFNCSCLRGVRGRSLNIKNNRITVETGYGRGMTFGAFGDFLHGIIAEDVYDGKFIGGIVVEGNYIDFARGSGVWRGSIARGGVEEDPEYRPDLFNHEYFLGFGIAVNGMPGTVRIVNNVVRNANARGIGTASHEASADVQIRHNTVESEVYGSYPFSSPEAGAGILAQSSAWNIGPGFHVEIEENTIKLTKLNYSGIKVLGPSTDQAKKLVGGKIRNNRIQLRDGYEGIHVRKCDDFEVADNTISGDAYYGIRISGRKKSGEPDLKALNNLFERNDMCDLRVREPDNYSNAHVDGRMFTGSQDSSVTAHIWLNEHTSGNVIKLDSDETVIDEGANNSIIRD